MFETIFLNTNSVWKSGYLHSTIEICKQNLKFHQKYVIWKYDNFIEKVFNNTPTRSASSAHFRKLSATNQKRKW
jgi:hypothetical protein